MYIYISKISNKSNYISIIKKTDNQTNTFFTCKITVIKIYNVHAVYGLSYTKNCDTTQSNKL